MDALCTDLRYDVDVTPSALVCTVLALQTILVVLPNGNRLTVRNETCLFYRTDPLQLRTNYACTFPPNEWLKDANGILFQRHCPTHFTLVFLVMVGCFGACVVFAASPMGLFEAGCTA
jgi:hypothetical protein